MYAFADVMHLFADEFAGLSAGGFALALIALHPLHCLTFRHESTPAR
ncbi:MAG: hypothetical protein ABSH23_10335 [Steroidobacteraceae bacterium]|jgi:hypothetical protein